MSLDYSLRRRPGGPVYSAEDRAAARRSAAAGDPPTLTAEAVAAMTDPGGIRVVADVIVELESNRFARPTTVELLVNGQTTAPGSGEVATLVDGYRTSDPTRPAVTFPVGVDVAAKPAVRFTWMGSRFLNRVEVSGDSSVGQITGARVSYRTPAGAWVTGPTGTAPAGRLVVDLGQLVEATGIEVLITAATGNPIALVEVDPIWVLDVSDRVVSLDVEWSREADPGATASPVGNYEAASASIVLDDSDGFWNPATNASLDVGHRFEVALGVAYVDQAGQEWEELLPAGVFYSEPFDTDSDSTTVSITAVDLLGRRGDVEVSEDVKVNATVGTLVTDLARKYLDLDGPQVAVDPTIAATVIPYAYPSGSLGTYLADLAKATGAVVHIDALGRLVVGRRTDTTDEVVASFTDETALLRFRRPPGYDSTTSIVNLTAAPLVQGAIVDLWAMPAGGVKVPASGTYRLVARYDDPPAVNGYVSGIVADGSYTLTRSVFYSDRAEVDIRNNETRQLVVADLRVKGNPLVEGTLTARKEHAPSVARYGPRTLDVEARLIQTQDQLDLVADILLDAFRSVDDDGVRRLPEVEFDALGLMHVTTGDRVTLAWPDKGLGGDYTVLSRRLAYADGALLFNGCRAREAPLVPAAVADVSIADDVYVAGY